MRERGKGGNERTRGGWNEKTAEWDNDIFIPQQYFCLSRMFFFTVIFLFATGFLFHSNGCFSQQRLFSQQLIY